MLPISFSVEQGFECLIKYHSIEINKKVGQSVFNTFDYCFNAAYVSYLPNQIFVFTTKIILRPALQFLKKIEPNESM